MIEYLSLIHIFIQLSRKKLASRKGMEEIAKAAESGEVVEGDVTEFNLSLIHI